MGTSRCWWVVEGFWCCDAASPAPTTKYDGARDEATQKPIVNGGVMRRFIENMLVEIGSQCGPFAVENTSINAKLEYGMNR